MQNFVADLEGIAEPRNAREIRPEDAEQDHCEDRGAEKKTDSIHDPRPKHLPKRILVFERCVDLFELLQDLRLVVHR